MRISLRSPAGGSSPFVPLADEAAGAALADRISGFQPALHKSPQIEPLAFSDEIFVAERGNRQWTLTFNVDRLHADAPAALRFLAEHPLTLCGSVGVNIDLKIEVSSQAIYMFNCVLVEFVPNPHSDQSTVCRYGFIGGSFTTDVITIS